MNDSRHHNSSFWPTLLIGVGLIWLLVNLGIIAPANLNSIWQFWPLLLVWLGLDIIFRHQQAWIGDLIGILAVGGLVAYLVLQPSTGIVQTTAQIQQENFSSPISDTASVTYNFETASEPVNIYALASNSDKLIDANLVHQGNIDFSVTGNQNKLVVLSEQTDPSSWFNWNLNNPQSKWDIGIAGSVDSDITIDGGSGTINADFTGIKLQRLSLDLGSGASTFTLPQMEENISADLNSGSGSVNLTLPVMTNLLLRVESGSGALNINVPEDAALQVVVMDSGSGSLNLPANLARISGSDETGTWQTDNFEKADYRITIKIMDQGSGSISVN
jgi:hypothetical protein